MRFAKAVATVSLLIVVFSGLGSPVRAQGFGLYEQGACAMGRDGAGVAAPCDDGSAVFFNPAGLALERRAVVSLGGEAIAPRGQFTNSKTGLVSPLNAKTFYAPAFYMAAPAGRLVVGVGVYAPYGLTSDWPETTEGRYLGYYSSLKGIYVQPTVAFRVNDMFMVGAGLDITHLTVDLRRRVDLSTTAITGGGGLTFGAIGVPAGTDFADVDLTGSANHVGAHFGTIVKASDRLSLGARYLLGQQVDITNGQVTTKQVNTGLALRVPLGPTLPAGTPIDAILAPAFATGQALSNQTATTSIALPDQFVAGVALKPTPVLAVFVDYQYTHWAKFDEVRIVNQYAPVSELVMAYNDTHGIRLGTEFNVRGSTVLRAGFDAHTAAAPDQSVTPLLPEAPRKEVTLGAGIPFGKLRLDLAYMYIHQSDRAGRTTNGGMAVPTAAVNNGTYHYYANLFAASFVVRF